MKNKILAVVSISTLVLVSCGKPKPKGDFFIPSDSKAQYFILEKGGTKNQPTIITKRVGSSGDSYSKRIYSCKENKVKYLASSSTQEGMKNSKPDSKMSPIIHGSIAYHVGKQACK